MTTRSTTTKTKVYEVDDAWEWLELAYENGWTDGLPVAPPTEERVRAMVEHVKKKPDELLGVVPPLMGKATVEKVAIQAVMAGCKSEYFPVVLAALECILCEDDKQHFNIKGVQDTTNPVSPLVIVSGPAVKELGFHYKENAFGGVSRANASVGRAVRLILWNLGGARPGETDMTHLGHPGKYSFCIAENPDPAENPWTKLNVEWGYPATQSTVTVFGCEAPRNILTLSSVGYEGKESPETTLRLIARAMATPSNNVEFLGQILVTFGPRVVEHLHKAKYTKETVRKFLFDNARNRLGDLIKDGFYIPEKGNSTWTDYAPWVDQTNPETRVPIVEQEGNIHIVVTGATRLPWNSICHGWGNFGAYAVTRPIRSPS